MNLSGVQGNFQAYLVGLKIATMKSTPPRLQAMKNLIGYYGSTDYETFEKYRNRDRLVKCIGEVLKDNCSWNRQYPAYWAQKISASANESLLRTY